MLTITTGSHLSSDNFQSSFGKSGQTRLSMQISALILLCTPVTFVDVIESFFGSYISNVDLNVNKI